MDRKFMQAIAQGGAKNKAKLYDCGGKPCVVAKNGNPYLIHTFRFMRTDGSVVVHTSDLIDGLVPTLEIPKPPVKRNNTWEGKFFLHKPNMIGYLSRTPGFPPELLPHKGATLYAPFHFFYFEETVHEEVDGFMIKSCTKYSSKFDRKMSFIDRVNETEREDPNLKAKAMELYTTMEDLQRQADELEQKLAELDPMGKIADEFKRMREKLMTAAKGGDGEW